MANNTKSWKDQDINLWVTKDIRRNFSPYLNRTCERHFPPFFEKNSHLAYGLPSRAIFFLRNVKTQKDHQKKKKIYGDIALSQMSFDLSSCTLMDVKRKFDHSSPFS